MTDTKTHFVIYQTKKISPKTPVVVAIGKDIPSTFRELRTVINAYSDEGIFIGNLRTVELLPFEFKILQEDIDVVTDDCLQRFLGICYRLNSNTKTLKAINDLYEALDDGLHDPDEIYVIMRYLLHNLNRKGLIYDNTPF